MDKIVVKSRISEVDTVSKRIIGAYKKSSLNSDPHLSSLFGELEEHSKQLTLAINPNKALSVMEDKDEVRDGRIRALYHRLKTSVLFEEAPVVKAANKLLDAFDKYGLSMLKESYAMESSLIDSMLKDFSIPEISEAIDQVPGCRNNVNAIIKAQSEFEDARIAYGESKGEEANKATASKIKEELLELFNETMILYIAAMGKVDRARYGAFARTVSNFIDENNDAVAKRQKRDPEADE